MLLLAWGITGGLSPAATGSAGELAPVTLAWQKNPEPDIAGYILSYGTRSGHHPTSLNVGLKTTATLTTLQPGVTYYFVVRAYNRDGLRSLPSAEISYRGGVIVANRPPVTRMLAPTGNLTIIAGESLAFRASASDPDGDQGLFIRWNFGAGSGIGDVTGSATGMLRFDRPGTFAITATAVDPHGLADPKPARRTITVVPAWSEVPRNTWKLVSVSSQEADGFAANLAFDGNPKTFWHTAWREPGAATTRLPHDLRIDLGSSRYIKGFRYLPRQDQFRVGDIGRYAFYVSANGKDWGSAVATGTFTSSADEKTVFSKPKRGRFIRLVALTEANGNRHTAIAELGILEGPVPNRPPVAKSRGIKAQSGKPKRIVLRATDPDGDRLSYRIHAQPRRGKLTGTFPNLVYQPRNGFTGKDRIVFSVHDGRFASKRATIQIRVQPAKTANKAVAANKAKKQAAPAKPVRGTVTIDGRKYRTLTVPKPADPKARPLVIQVSGDLVKWFSGRRHTTVMADNRRILKVRDNTPVQPGRKRHIRLNPSP